MREGAVVETSGRIIDTGARYPLTSQDFFGHRGRRPAPMTKYVYFFGGGHAEGSSVMRNLLGGKGCELAEMTNLGIPVPPGFTVMTQAWAHYNRCDRQVPRGLGGEGAGGSGADRGRRRARARRRQAAAPGVRAVGRARVHAGDDGDRP